MIRLISFVILLIFIFLWCRPVLKKQKELGGYIDRKTKVTAVILGLIPTTIVLLLCQFVLGWIFKLTGLENYEVLMCFLRSFVMYALIEELTKYGFARILINKNEKLKKIDIMLIFGLVGMGYEIAEATFFGNPFGSIVRGIFISHIIYQFIMGHFFYESIHAKKMGDAAGAKKNMILTFAIPMLIHGFNDLFCEFIPLFLESGPDEMPVHYTGTQIIGGVGCNVVILLINIIALIWGLKLIKKDPEAEIIISDTL